MKALDKINKMYLSVDTSHAIQYFFADTKEKIKKEMKHWKRGMDYDILEVIITKEYSKVEEVRRIKKL